MSELNDLVQWLQAYCASKPGVSPSVKFGPNFRYDLITESLGGFALLFVVDQPPFVRLRCKTTTIESFSGRGSLEIIQGPGSPNKQPVVDNFTWNWVKLSLVDSPSKAEIMRLVDESWEITYSRLNASERETIEILEKRLPIAQTLEALIDVYDLVQRKTEILNLLQTAIGVHTYPIDPAKLALAQSRIGGSPDFPEGWSYPDFEGFPLAFLAQINLAELPEIPARSPLPDKGILYFFSMYGWMAFPEFDSTDFWISQSQSGFTQVLYFDGDLRQLRRQVMPERLKTFRLCGIQLIEQPSLPRVSFDPAIDSLNWSDIERDHYTEMYLNGFHHTLQKLPHPPARHQLLGYADFIQDPITDTETHLLFQLDTFDPNSDMMLADGGVIYFVIQREKLAQLDFSSVRTELQSS